MSHGIVELGAPRLEGYRFDPSEEKFLPDKNVMALAQPGPNLSPNARESISYIKMKEQNLHSRQLAKYATPKGRNN